MEHKDLATASLLAAEMKTELETNILPFWMTRMNDPRGGFYGRISGEGVVETEAVKGAILNARLLWSFSSAYRLLGRPEYLESATRAKREIIDRFYDPEFGGVFWSLNADGTPSDTKKQIYAIGFAIYGLSEYARATGDAEALDYAVRLFHDIEKHSFDREKNGYFEAFARDWSPISDMRLSEKDANDCKTMNTHLHILEPYTNLFRVWPDPELGKQIRNLLGIFTEKILDSESGHLRLFFDEDWNSSHDVVSYGHDIEASWLMYEAAEVLGDEALVKSVAEVAAWVADAAAEGFLPKAGMVYESDNVSGSIDADRHWWVQAETVVGYFNIWQMTRCGAGLQGETALRSGTALRGEEALRKAVSCWEFIKAHIVDRIGGEWVWSLRADGTLNREDDKAGFWKCPYHNSRMCLEVIERVSKMVAEQK